MKKILTPILIFIGLGIQVNAQEKTSQELKGDKYAFNYSYSKAVNSYTHSKDLTIEGQRMLAESYSKIDSNTQSEAAYAKLISLPAGVLPEDHYNYAMILKINGKYEQSDQEMARFNELKPTDLRARSYVDTKAQLVDLLKDNGKYKIKHLDVNTSGNDFGTSYYKDKIVFASTRATPKMIQRKDNWTGEPYLNMYVSEVKDEQLKKPKIFDKGLDGRLHDGPASFNKEGTLIAFTRNHYHDKSNDKVVELQIYFSSYTDKKWSDPEPFMHNNTAYSVGHPCLSADGNTMYFTSDMPGGYGKTDIYRTTRSGGGAWTKPENMGDKVNTEGDEMFPFFEGTNKVLFFTSNGRFGLGGFDIFVCEINGSEPGRVYNAGAPLNTQYDDFALITDETITKGYFSSNRTGGKGNDDIYSTDILKVLEIHKKITGIAKNVDAIPLSQTFVTLSDDKGNVLDTVTTKEDGTFTFLVDTDKNFKLLGKKRNYLNGDTTFNTFGKDLLVKADVILLTKAETIAKKIKVNADLAVVMELNAIYFDLDKSNIREDAKIELDKIVKIMNEYPQMVVELSSYADCRASEQYNQVLSDKRAKSSAQYIKRRITNPLRISGNGYGETKNSSACPCENNAVSNCSDEEYQKARNTTFIIVRNDVTVH